MLQLVPLPAGFGRRFCEAAELGIDVTPRISIAPHETLVDAVQLAGCIALFFLTRELTRRTEHGLFVGAIGLAAIGGWQAVQGIEQYATGLVSDDAEAIARGAFVHRGHYAALLAGSAGVAVGLAASYLRRLPWLGVAAGAAAGLSLVAAAASLSRLGLVAALCSMLLAAGALTRRRAGLTAAALLVTLGAGAAVVNPEHVTQRFSELIEQRGDPGRLAIWRDSVRALEEGPLLGSGLGAFPYAFRRSEMYFPRKSVEHAHSDYLEFVVELGALGAGMLFLAIGAVFVSAVRGVRAEADDSRRPIRLGCLAGAAAIAVCATADFPLHSPPVAAMLAALLGLADATTEHRTGVRGPKLERSTRLWDPGLPSGASVVCHMGVCLRFDRARSPVGLFPMGSRNALPRSNPSRHGPTRPSRRGAFQRSPGAEPLQRTCLAVPGRDRACARPATASARALADSESRGTADASHGVAIGGARALDLPFRRDRGRGPRLE